MTETVEIVRLQSAIEATNKEVARTQQAMNKELLRTHQEIAHLKVEVDKLRQWKSWIFGATATIGILIGLFASKIKSAFGIQ